jgi:hypothetical protein
VSRASVTALKSLGATISESFGESTTHLIWSNGTAKRLAAAVILDVTVILPGWIEKCKQTGKRCEEADYIVINGISSSQAAASVLSFSTIDVYSGVSKNGRGRKEVTSSSSSGRVNERVERVNERVERNHVISHSHSDSHLDKSKALPSFIPLPAFREHNMVVLPPALRTQRRSERICDLDEEVRVRVKVRVRVRVRVTS